MEIKADVFARGNELCNVKILNYSFIELKKNEGFYCINCNKQGLKSFIMILNKLKSCRYNFIHLADIHINDFYTYSADYFFDYPSMALDLYKIRSCYKKDIVSEYEGLNNKTCLKLLLSRKTIVLLLAELKKILKSEKCLSAFTFNDDFNTVIKVNLDDYQPKRK